MPETNESTNRSSRPDPLRLPLLVVAGGIAPWVYARWLAGTGGQHVRWWQDLALLLVFVFPAYKLWATTWRPW